MEIIDQAIAYIRDFVWGLPMIAMLIGTHIYFTLRLGFIQRLIPKGIRLSFSKKARGEGEISGYGALATALAATIGTGNIIGISTAIAIGGPGAVFWCWITGVLGIATTYSECLLSLLYRVRKNDGSYQGGPMYVLRYGLGYRIPAFLFCIFAILASLGVGSSVQSHSICSALTGKWNLPPSLIGMTAAVLCGFVIIGGVKQIAKVCSFLVPFMGLLYMGGCFVILIMNAHYLLPAIHLIVESAFQPKSAFGGFCGSTILTAARIGIARGLFTNESGLGSIPMAAASAKTGNPVSQALISMTGTFWDTVIICAVTGIVIVSSLIRYPASADGIAADRLCFVAFEQLSGTGIYILTLSLVLFAFATMIGWCVYGERAVIFLFGERGINPYRVLYLVSIFLGSVTTLGIVWNFSDMVNALMAIPNLLSLLLLRDKIVKESKRYLKKDSHV